ncbi:phage tail protein [Paraburkholderia xenovorans]|uniref:phage tail protein n=1 Tax=Paraburkholderia xenovorans TaxID=36873 RepID=UPI0038BDE725
MNNSVVYQPAAAHRFSVTFFFGRLLVPNILDCAFQSISGLSRELDVSVHSEGGENIRNQYFAGKLQHGSLRLERGVMVLTPLSAMFNWQLTTGKLMYLHAVITLFDLGPLPLCNWLIVKALPVGWQTGTLDANSNTVLINTLELRYQEMIPLGLKL